MANRETELEQKIKELQEQNECLTGQVKAVVEAHRVIVSAAEEAMAQVGHEHRQCVLRHLRVIAHLIRMYGPSSLAVDINYDVLEDDVTKWSLVSVKDPVQRKMTIKLQEQVVN